MGAYRNTLPHRIGPVDEDGVILRIRSGAVYEAVGALEDQVQAIAGQEPVDPDELDQEPEPDAGTDEPEGASPESPEPSDEPSGTVTTEQLPDPGTAPEPLPDDVETYGARKLRKLASERGLDVPARATAEEILAVLRGSRE